MKIEAPDPWKEKAKKIPGLSYVVFAISLLVLLVLPKSQGNWRVILSIWLVSFTFYYISGFLDGWIFDRLYGLSVPERSDFDKRIWTPIACFIFFKWLVEWLPGTKNMEKTRKKAGKKLRPDLGDDREPNGIYGSAEKIFHGKDEWQDKVQLWLELSKFARAFVIPLFIVLILALIYTIINWPNAPKALIFSIFGIQLNIPLNISILGINILNIHIFDMPPSIIDLFEIFILLIFFLVLYIWWRILHMNALYSLVDNAEVFCFEVTTSRSEQKKLVCIGSVIIPIDELPIYKQKPRVDSIKPTSGPASGGTTVTITGFDFTTVSGVSFGDTPASKSQVDSDTQITATSPAGRGTVDITVTNSQGTSSTSANDQFTYW